MEATDREDHQSGFVDLGQVWNDSAVDATQLTGRVMTDLEAVSVRLSQLRTAVSRSARRKTAARF